MEFLLGLIYIIIIGAVLFCMAALLFRGEETLSNRIYFGCQGMLVLWCVSQLLQLMAHNQTQLTAAYLIGNIGICFIGSTWYYFSRAYTGSPIKGISKYLPIATSLFHYGMFLTNSWHHLYYTVFQPEEIRHGILFYTHMGCTYFWVAAGAVILYRHMKNEQILEKRLVIASVLIPIAFNIVYLLGLVHSSFDITMLGFAISTILVMLATMKYQFMNLRKELAITNEKLLLEKERNRIAQQVHDTAGHTLTMIQSYMKLAGISASRENYEEVNQYLSEARVLTGKGIRELRESINMLRQEAEYELVTQGVMQLANQVKEIPVEVTIKGKDDKRYSHLSKTIYDTVRESVTNTLKYANASKLDIIIRFETNYIEIIIGDDGIGCANLTANNGIRGIRERVENAGGTVRFSTSAGEGFLTRVKLPV